ncbi:pyridoxamine 5'-phosphate oxidase family protein [Acidovorax sp. MR-S7]|uniref:pyridoxamine 5'-phosphate oxidase family protein n=1 Tax=Acidovorax sp. MR-S7 TaxID=1268622 RepID=UPI00037975AD|nr:pyridoxamine 5'-phosphate oxidase family protein [Acidovorax sp. MR-S7]
MSALPPEWLRHLSTLTSFRLGSCDRGGQPHVCRALAADALPDGRMLVLVAEHAAPRVVAALRATGQAALLMTSPRTNRTLHVKGQGARVEPALPEQAALLARCQRRLAEEIAEVDGFGNAAPVVAHWYRVEPGAVVAIRFSISGAWDQTPGPHAGQPVDLLPA